ncbi:ABC transporter permease [Sphaerisporangium sp. TRM90804]|uniref:ABC transporter permease n=1 Tax=Sphaerisporangium sp. TRM90804 TaxID=3031113 RepID=UPI00244BA4F1|nr:ABC transporter permease [Sphaerisporangium sp. TRM90804]MDH2429196.1 ABC transporter permease [Sphaerisporangium sp. TRM90804]
MRGGAPAAGREGPAATAAETLLLAGRGVRRYLRSPQQLVNTVVMPLVLLFMMLAVFGGIVGGAGGGPYVERLAPAVVLFAAASGAVVTGVGFHLDLHTGLADRLRTMPISRASPLLGRMAADLARVLITAVASSAAAHVAGFRFTQGPLAALGFFAVVLAFGSIFMWVALVIALAARSVQAVNTALTMPATFLLFFSSGFAPVDAFPGFLRPLVGANPLSSATDAAIGLSSGGGPVAVPVLQTLAWALAVTAVAAPLAVRLYRRRDVVVAA